MTLLNPFSDVYAVEVPEDYWCFHFKDDFLMAFPVDGGGGIKGIAWHTHLPNNDNYEILFQTKLATEEDWDGLIPKRTLLIFDESSRGSATTKVFADYTDSGKHFYWAKKSGISLLKANGLNPEVNHLLIRKIN